MAEAKKLVIDCSAAGAATLLQEAGEWRRLADDAAMAGHDDLCRQYTAQADRLQEQAEVEAGGREFLSYQELTAEETNQRKVDAEAAQADAVRQLRLERDALLIASDWTQLNDAPLNDAQRKLWVEYRQALRDLPQHPNPVWPTPPV